MLAQTPYCPTCGPKSSSFRTIVRNGGFYRRSDKRWIPRYKCALCARGFSRATRSPCFGQNKRQLNPQIFKLLASGVSQRRISRLLRIHQTTVARKLAFLGLEARRKNLRDRLRHHQMTEIQFDDLETFEHTKLKPLSVTLAVEKHSRYIIGFEVSKMPAKGHLAKKSRKKYGRRPDERVLARDRLFRRMKRKIHPLAIIESDENPHYSSLVRGHFPHSTHLTIKGQRGCVTGQGELKKISFDPLFSLNHTCAMLRANINRLFRKTWCTTKRIQPLIDHLEIYMLYHNRRLLRQNLVS